MKSCIHLIRHGITEGNLKHWFYGWADVSLTDQGRKDLADLRDAGVYPILPDDANIYTSDLIRTRQTLEIIYGNRPHTESKLLREMNFGDWEAKTYDELLKLDVTGEWTKAPFGDFQYPGGESPQLFYERIRKGFGEVMGMHRMKQLSHRHSGKDAVTCLVIHGGVIAASMSIMFPGEKDIFWKWVPDPGHGYTVYFEHSDPVRYEKF